MQECYDIIDDDYYTRNVIDILFIESDKHFY